MNPGGSGWAATLTIGAWSLVAGLPDFKADALWRPERGRFGRRPLPLSCVGTLVPCQRPAPDELDAREERSMPVVQYGRVFTAGPAPANPYTIQLERYYQSLLSQRAKSGNKEWIRAFAHDQLGSAPNWSTSPSPCGQRAVHPLLESQGLSRHVRVKSEKESC
jgi:hypothetical protein